MAMQYAFNVLYTTKSINFRNRSAYLCSFQHLLFDSSKEEEEEKQSKIVINVQLQIFVISLHQMMIMSFVWPETTNQPIK